MITWREYWRRYPDRTFIAVGGYIDVLDAIDDARAKAYQVEISLTDEKVVAMFIDKTSGKLLPLVAKIPPTVPVRINDTGRLAVGLLQIGEWQSTATWRDFVHPRDAQPMNGQIPSYWRLLQRKFELDTQTAADLARFIIVRHADNRLEWGDADAALILRALESNFRGPVRGCLRTVLRSALHKLEMKRARMARGRRFDGRKIPNRRVGLLIERVSSLLSRRYS